MSSTYKEKYKINPLTFSQSDLRNYNQITTSELLIINSNHLGENFNQVDYQILNNLDWSIPKGKFKYKNKTKEELQISIYNNTRWKSKYGYINKIPEYASIIEPEKIFSLDIKEERYQVVVTNKTGEIILNEKVTIVNKL